MQIGELSQRAGLPAKTIRYYEEIGLLPPPKRLENSYRDYGEVDVARARFVAGARRLDFSLDDIQEILDLRDRRTAPLFPLLLSTAAYSAGARIFSRRPFAAFSWSIYHWGGAFLATYWFSIGIGRR